MTPATIIPPPRLVTFEHARLHFLAPERVLIIFRAGTPNLPLPGELITYQAPKGRYKLLVVAVAKPTRNHGGEPRRIATVIQANQCPTCNGSEAIPAPGTKCPECGGSGKKGAEPCPDCDSTGTIDYAECPTCIGGEKPG